ncbi:DNA-processing protein DprA [Pedobacter sp. PAMC26386]|nr:DNA-processing protein DprA [Pedobacter sp. PAMC26386]
MQNNNLLHLIAYSKIRGVGPAFFKKHFKSIKAFNYDLGLLAGIGGKSYLKELEQNLEEAKELIATCGKLKISILSVVDEAYPASLLEIKDPPVLLYIQGDIKLFSRCFCVIGSRNSTILGNRIANKIAAYFVQKWSLCTVFQEGIDESVLIDDQVVIPFATGILSCGLNLSTTASEKVQLSAAQVLENGGVLISEYEPDKKEDQFLDNKVFRIQAGLSRGLILVQSSDSDKAKYTLRAFSQLKRPLGVISLPDNEEFISSNSFSMNRSLIKDKVKGLQEITGISDLSKIKAFKIIPIHNREDYTVFEEEVLVSPLD